MSAHAPAISFRTPVLPWTVAADDEWRFRRILRRILAVVLVLAVGLPFVPLHPLDRAQTQPLPPPVARLLLERPVAPVPPPTRPEPAADAAQAPAPEAAPDKTEAAKPPKTQSSRQEARDPQPGKAPGEVALDNARRKASGVGLLAMKSEIAQITGAPLAAQFGQDIKPGPGLGAGSGPGVGAGSEAGVPVRALITSNATGGSGGINTAAYSSATGGGGLAGRATTLVEGVAGGGGGGGSGAGAGARATGSGAGKGGTLARAAGGKASRSIEEIKLVFERHKGAIYALYNRALRDDPALQGKVVLELRIAPSGQVEGLRIVSSDLRAEELERKLLARIRQFDFGARDVEVMVVTWPVDFLPS